jgi:histidinol dehydrogenase
LLLWLTVPESVDRVDKVVGPGNVYVQVAKYLLQGVVAVDGVEGPTELVVLADDSADPDEVVLDMRAQAEHGRSSTIVLISSSDKLVGIVEDRLSSDEHTYFIIKVKDVEEGMKLVNELAPEHLSLHTSSNYELLSMVSNVGAVSLKTPSAIIDYLGPNHILPTNGLARFRGALTVYDFMKAVVVAEGSLRKSY